MFLFIFNIITFLFPIFSLFFPCQPLLEKMIKDNGIINILLNKNLKTLFYILRRKGLILKLGQLIDYQTTETFTEKVYRKCAPKASPRSLYDFNKLPKTANSRKKLFWKKIFWKTIIKNVKKVSLSFPFEPSPFCREYYEKQKGSRTSHQSLFRLQILFRKIPFLVIYYLGNLDDLI